MLVIESLEPEVPVLSVDQFVQHEVDGVFGGCVDHVQYRSNHRAEIELHNQGMVHPEPPDARRVYAVIEQVAYGLVKNGGLADPTRPEDQLIPLWFIAQEPLPQTACQWSLHPRSQRRRYVAEREPGVLLTDNPPLVFQSWCPGSHSVLTLTRYNS